MTNLAFEENMKELGIGFSRSGVGDRYVSEMMQEKNWIYGGENSGHILLKDFHTTGDGIISALQVMKAIKKRQISFDQAVSEINLYPQILLNIPLDKDIDLEADEIQNSIHEAEKLMNNNGRVLLRKSGTEPLIRIMTEAKDKHNALDAANLIKETITK
jgi:phosphoglucosamine mutase